jgi:hypothetical protein
MEKAHTTRFDASIAVAGDLKITHTAPVAMPGNTPEEVDQRSKAALALSIVDENRLHPEVEKSTTVGKQPHLIPPNPHNYERDVHPGRRWRRRRH